MLAILLYFNYWHGLQKLSVGGNSTKAGDFIGYYLLYFIPFATAFLLQLFFYKNCNYFKNTWFWIILFLAPAIFSFRVNFNFYAQWINEAFEGADQYFYLHTLSWVVRVVVLLIPVYIIWLLKDKNKQPFYGTKALQIVNPYVIMLLIMIPLITLASTQKDFLHMYPKAAFISNLPATGSSRILQYIFFELTYGLDFVSIEYFFRGFLILGLMRICGEHCIIPVACFYCTIHFGKPMAEAISSFFGGMLLSIICYNTGSIWGGLIVHLGIAWMMEIGGLVGNSF